MYLLEVSNIHSPSTTSRLGKALVSIKSLTYCVADSVASLTGRHTPQLLLSGAGAKHRDRTLLSTNRTRSYLSFGTYHT